MTTPQDTSATQSINLEQPELPQLEEILTTHKKLNQIKDSLNHIIDAMMNKPSMLSRASRFWNETPLWQKISGGLGFIAPAFFVGIFAHVVVLTTLSITALFVYTLSSVLLDDHFVEQDSSLKQLKEAFESFASLLSALIQLLDTLQEQLAAEIKKLNEGNILLTNNVGDLKSQIDELTLQIDQFKTTELKLRATQMELETASQNLQAANEEQSKLIQLTQSQLEHTMYEHEQNQIQLCEQIIALTNARAQREEQFVTLKQGVSSLQKLTTKLSSTLIKDEAQRAALQERLADFLSHKEQSIELLIENITQSADALSQTKDKYKLSIERHKMLVDQYELIIECHKKVVTQMEHAAKPRAQVLGHFGLYATGAKDAKLEKTFENGDDTAPILGIDA